MKTENGIRRTAVVLFSHHLVLFVALSTQLLLSSCSAQPSIPPSRPLSAGMSSDMRAPLPFLTGAEVFISNITQSSILNSQYNSVAVVANQSSLVGDRHLVDTLLACGVHVTTIFCPEHGFRGNSEAGASIKNSTDTRTGLPIVSLYGKNKKPTPAQMDGIDAVIFDLQDVGCRFYTYISTLHYVMEACAEAAIPCIVLDRPNPNGHYVDGPVLDTAHYRSFIGMHPVPIVYGLTIGEYATMINGEHWLRGGLQCDLTVVKMDGYRRDSIYALPVAPSPNLQSRQSIALYPSLCLFEGTNISVGRGTDTPFEIIGAPGYKTRYAEKEPAPHIIFTPHPIKGVSENPPHKGKECRGLNLRTVKAPTKFDLTFLLWMYRHTPHDTFFKGSNSFELLAGTASLRKQLQQGLGEAEIRASWEPALSNYKMIRKNYLLYPDVEQR